MEHSETISEELDISVFKGMMLRLVQAYIDLGILDTQEKITKFTEIVRGAKFVFEEDGERCASETREYFRRETWRAFGQRMDLYRDPEKLLAEHGTNLPMLLTDGID